MHGGHRYASGDEEEMSGRDSELEQESLTAEHRAQSRGLGLGLDSSGVGVGVSGFGSGSGSGGSGALREGMEVENDDDEEVEIDSDLEDELPASAESMAAARALNADQPQQCNNRLALYLIGVVTVLACEFTILLPAFYVRLFVIGLLYGVVWFSLSSCAVHMRICPGKRKPHSTLALTLYAAGLAAYIGGMVGASYYKQVWYFDQMDTAYWQVNPDIAPTNKAAPMYNPTFLEFQHDPAANLTAFVHILPANAPDSKAYMFGKYEEDDKVYCAAPIVSSKRKEMIPVAYWAVGRDCCDRVSGTFSVTCKYWGENIPTRSAGLFMLSGEVLEDRHEAPYRKAVQEYLTAVNPGVQETSDSLLVVAMKYEDHIERQDERRRKAYIALLLTAALWPLVLVMLAAAQWAFDTVTGACASKPHHTQ